MFPFGEEVLGDIVWNARTRAEIGQSELPGFRTFLVR
jgi:hypothetical protein